jgi:hypothetical protein
MLAQNPSGKNRRAPLPCGSHAERARHSLVRRRPGTRDAGGELARRRPRPKWSVTSTHAFAGAVLGAALVAGAALLSGCGGAPGKAAAAAAPPPSASFTDVAEASGLRYEWRIPGQRPLNILQTIGNGCAFLDYDRDGSLDVLLVGSRLALFRGDGRGRFTDVSGETGLSGLSGRFLGCAVGDADGDGWRDVYVTGYRTGLLLKNLAGRGFRDVTREAGLPPQPWGTSAAFAETLPGSGRLDLYVANYAVFGPKVEPQLCLENNLRTSCGPRHYQPLKGVLYQNLGQARFRDITRAAGAHAVVGRALGVAVADYDGSGRPAFAIANDEMPGDLLRPAGPGKEVRYSSVGKPSGTAYDRDGNVHGGMGIDWGDYDGDGQFDLFVATFMNETKSLYRNEDGVFTDMGIPTVLGAAAAPYVAFGCKFFDYDNDGWLDVAIANGHVQDNIQQINSSATYRQPSQLFRNQGGQPIVFEDVSEKSGRAFTRPIVGRGLATGDVDNDGRLEVLIVDAEGKPLLLRNETPATGHWLGVALTGDRSNRDGYGAVLTAQVGGRKLVRQCQSAGSYMSASDPRVHFGLDSAGQVDVLSVRWPSGRTDVLKNVPADRYIEIREGTGEAH